MRAFFICPAGRVATEDVMSEGVPGSPRPGPTDLFIMQCGYFYCGAIFRFAQNVPNSNEIKHKFVVPSFVVFVKINFPENFSFRHRARQGEKGGRVARFEDN